MVTERRRAFNPSFARSAMEVRANPDQVGILTFSIRYFSTRKQIQTKKAKLGSLFAPMLAKRISMLDRRVKG
jgi:hypothetical protein